MAGYIIAIDNINSMYKCIVEGTYATNFKELKNNFWKTHHEGTFADYIGMKPGDNIYFFIKRKIYGVGELLNIGEDCKYLNYEDADIPKGEIKVSESLIKRYDTSVSQYRCICTFRPSPYFFKEGIDMDDALASDPVKFRMLRAFWKLSFVKIDDEENRALRNIIIKKNEGFLFNGNETFDFNNNIHKSIITNLSSKNLLTSKNILKYSSENDSIKHEMAIECNIIEKLTKGNDINLGKWDYVSRQVIASPFKAIDYMDKMDIFCYKYIKGYDIISKYLIIEIKKGKADNDVISQLMKYVDWVNQEYTHGDYSMIEAIVIAKDYNSDIVEFKNKNAIRNYIKGRRPIISETWNDIKLLRYKYNGDDLELQEVQ